MNTKDKIEQILNKTFTLAYLDIIDESRSHVGHPEAKAKGGGHFKVLIVSDDFRDKQLRERHRMVYAALKEELKTQVHALAIKALTVQEYES